MENDIRWLQRLDNYHKACAKLFEVIDTRSFGDLSQLETEGLIQRFEYTFELAWKVMQDFLRYKGYEFVEGPNGTLAQAFEDGLISNHDGWRRMAKARITTSHTYNEEDAANVAGEIYDEYAELLRNLDAKLIVEKNRLENK